MSVPIKEALLAHRKQGKWLMTVLDLYPEAQSELVGNHRLTLDGRVQEDAVDVEIDMSSGHPQLRLYVPVDEGRVYAPFAKDARVVLDRLREKYPEAYKALVELVRE